MDWMSSRRRAGGTRLALCGAALLVLTVPSFSSPSSEVPAARSPDGPAAAADAVPGQLLVAFRPGTRAPERDAAHERVGGRLLRSLPVGEYDLVSLPERLDLERAIEAYAGMPAVARAEPNYRVRLALFPNDPCFLGTCAGVAGQWNLQAINAPLGWDAVPGTTYSAAEKRALAPVKVAVVDTRIDFSHPDFANVGGDTDASNGGQLRIADARNWVLSARESGNAAYHGTYVAGILAAATGNGADLASVGYRAEVIPLAVVDGTGLSDAASLAEAIRYAWERGARVINLSLGLLADSDVVHTAIIDVTSGANPALVVAAAGNNTQAEPFYPGSYEEVMSVSAFSANERLAACSNYNDNVSVSAPGDGVVSLAPMPERLRKGACGTSSAAPHVSGLAALLFAQDPARTAEQVRGIIERTADDDAAKPGWDRYFGWGRINVDRALREGIGPRTSDVAATIPPREEGRSTISAVARGPAPITAAEAYLDRAGDPATRIALAPADGAWGGAAEALTGTIAVPATMAAGPHRLFVRAFDGSWGAAATGVLLVDRGKPHIVNLRAGNVIRALGRSSAISFTITDDYSTLFDYRVQVLRADGQIVWEEAVPGVRLGLQQTEWVPEPGDLPGVYRAEVEVVDQAGNRNRASAATVVV